MFGTPCGSCGGATAIGRAKDGSLVRVCAVNRYHRETVEPAARTRPPRELASPWWAA